MLALEWSDVELDGARLRIHQSLVLVDGVPTLTKPKTDSSRRSIDLDLTTVTALRQHRTAQLEERLAWGEGYSTTQELVFCREDGTAYRPDYISRAFTRIVSAAGLPRIPLHGLGHTHATALMAAGTHPKVVQERLGHSSISVTLDTYSAVIPTMQRDAIDRLAAFIDT